MTTSWSPSAYFWRGYSPTAAIGTIMADKTNVHHLFSPRSWYRKAGGIAWEFFQLPCNQVRIPVAIHDEVHAVHKPMAMPSVQFMTYRVHLYESGQCACTHHQAKVVSLDTERRVRRGRKSR